MNEPIIILPLKPRDIPQVLEWGKREPAFMGFWSEDILHNFVEDGLSRGIYLEHREIIGFVLATYQPITHKLTWENAYVNRGYRGTDSALRAFEEVWGEAKKRGALFAESLVKAGHYSPERMLSRAGFTSQGEFLWYHKTS